MSRIRQVGIVAVMLGTMCPGFARAEDISAKGMSIKDNTDPAKRQVQVQSKDLGVAFSEAGDPGANGAALHVYSATDDFCAILPAGSDWTSKSSQWKYKNKASKNSAQIKDGNLAVKIKSGVTYTLLDNTTQGVVNVQVQFGSGTRYCMQCTGNKKDTGKKFQGKLCAAAPCAAEPSVCGPPTSTTTTSTSSTTSTTVSTGTILKGSLTATGGRFNYNLTLGVPGANSACSTTFPGTHACTYSELQAAETAGDLVGLKDRDSITVTSFWAIDPLAPPLQQCNDDAPVTGSGINWEYGTAHTISRGQRVTLNNVTGILGVLETGLQCNIFATASNWVGCCQ